MAVTHSDYKTCKQGSTCCDTDAIPFQPRGPCGCHPGGTGQQRGIPPIQQENGTAGREQLLAEPPGLPFGSVSKAGTDLTAPCQHRPRPGLVREETSHILNKLAEEAPHAAEPFQRHERTLAVVLFDKPNPGDPRELQTARLTLLPKETTQTISGVILQEPLGQGNGVIYPFLGKGTIVPFLESVTLRRSKNR